MKAPLLNPAFVYHNAEASRKPGYLARKFAAYRKRMAKEEAESNVKPLRAKGR